MKECFIEYNPNGVGQKMINSVDQIAQEWRAKGYSMTLRQVYYQLVSRNVIENSENSYKALSSMLTRARMGGWLDWDIILDRTRMLRGYNTYTSPQEFLRQRAIGYHLDRWETQKTRVEIWVEKDALIDIVGQAAAHWHCDYFSCRGYVSASSMKEAADRFLRYERQGKNVVILHLGDHDPSGVNMSEDMRRRLTRMGVTNFELKRIALSMAQVKKYELPPNPTKLTDSRAKSYIDKYGKNCWELDALPPDVLHELIVTNILNYLDRPKYEKIEAKELGESSQMYEVIDRYDQVSDFVEYFSSEQEVDKLTEMLEERDSLIEEVNSLEHELADERDQNESAKKLLREELSNARETIDELNATIDSLGKRYEKLEAENVQLVQRLKQAVTKTTEAHEFDLNVLKVGQIWQRGKQKRIYTGIENHGGKHYHTYASPSRPKRSIRLTNQDARKWFGEATNITEKENGND